MEAAANSIIVVLKRNAPFNCMGTPFLGIHSMKVCPHALALAFASDKYNKVSYGQVVK
jgi:hypothetical protein